MKSKALRRQSKKCKQTNKQHKLCWLDSNTTKTVIYHITVLYYSFYKILQGIGFWNYEERAASLRKLLMGFRSKASILVPKNYNVKPDDSLKWTKAIEMQPLIWFSLLLNFFTKVRQCKAEFNLTNYFGLYCRFTIYPHLE